MNLPGLLRDDEVGDASRLAKWLSSLRSWLQEAVAERPRMRLFKFFPVTGTTGTFYIDRPPFSVGGVVLASVLPLDSAIVTLSASPSVTYLPLSDGRIRCDWFSLPSTGKFALSVLLVEAQ